MGPTMGFAPTTFSEGTFSKVQCHMKWNFDKVVITPSILNNISGFGTTNMCMVGILESLPGTSNTRAHTCAITVVGHKNEREVPIALGQTDQTHR
jgi:hypothetical protein